MAAATGRQRSSAVKMVLAALFVAVCMFVLQSRDSTPMQFRVREAGVTHVLVTGGAGFIGSHASLHLLTSGHRVTIVDNLSRGNWGAVQVLQRIAPEGRLQFINADLGDPRKVEAVFASNAIDVVMHFAAVAYVGESMQEPLRYYHNVTANTLTLVEVMGRHGVTQLIYSSTCATYGEPKTMPITEDTVQAPINPYGKSKKMAEDVILDYARANPRLAATILRYFNVIGSDPSGRLGEAPRPELRHHGRITGACFDAAMGKIDGLKVMGTDYPTADGTCIRDYIHVTDLVNAHVVAMHHLTPGTVNIYNVGTGKGYSVREFVNACLNVTGAPIKVMEQKARRPGDYAEVYSDPSKIYHCRRLLQATLMATPVAVAERELREYLDVAVAAARHAGEVIRRGFNAPKDVQHKGKVDLVTETDKQCEALIMQHISAAYPSHKFIGEEESSERGTAGLGDDPTWMVDPLDGTTNFVHRYPFVCVSIGLAINKAVVVGVVFNPILNEMFTAMRGHGAMLNDEPIHASSQADMGSALLATEIGTKRDAGTVAGLTGRISNLLFQVRSLRLSGSCALNLVGVACGRLDLFYEIGFGGPWDVAAGSLIVEEAGGLCFDPSVPSLRPPCSKDLYHPLPVVFAEAHGARITDPEGREYLDFLSAYSAVNQGHGNARILAALQQQAERCTLSSRAFHNDRFPLFAQRITALMGYDKVLPMNTGAEAVETALKVARKWAYEKKGVPANQALVISCCGCFHGRTMAAISMSCDNDATRGFGPLLPGHLKVDFGDVDGLQRLLAEHGPRVAAFIVEPIQGEAGVVVPPEGYLRAVRQLCSQHGVLLLADEIQTGLARTGRMLACDHEGVRPDVLILGKALGGGVVPVSAVLADDDVMGCIRPGEHGSTFGGNPLASAVALAALAEIEEGGLADRAQRLGEQLQAQLKAVQVRYPHLIHEVRGRGLLVAVQVAGEGLPGGVTALDVCVAMKERGVLAKPTHNTIIRLAPPLTISCVPFHSRSCPASLISCPASLISCPAPLISCPASLISCPRAFAHSAPHSFTPSLIHPLTHSPPHSFIPSLIHPLTHSSPHPLTNPFPRAPMLSSLHLLKPCQLYSCLVFCNLALFTLSSSTIHTPNTPTHLTTPPAAWHGHGHGREEELGRAAAALEAVLGEDMPRLVAQAAAAGADNKTHSKEPCDRCGRVR
ncbi:unnamed protein product [Closterium sp. NIES-64]|nr:unnamed protein product [Closterium sp. NIES-64]